MYDIHLLNSIPILEVAKALGIKVNRNKKALCFNHKENVPSLSFETKINIFKCFGCGIKGNVIKLVQEYNEMSFPAACNWISSNFSYHPFFTQSDTSISIINKNYCKPYNYKSDKIASHYVPDSEVYSWLLAHSNGLSQKGKKYLNDKRKFSSDLIEKLKIFDIMDPKTTIYSMIKVFGFDRVVKCGLYTKYPIWNKYVIVFPFFDIAGNIIYFQGRYLPRGFRNLNDVPTVPWNLQIFKKLNNHDSIYICEGITDTIAALELHLNAIGILGVDNFKEEYINYFKFLKVYVISDNDEAGDRMFCSLRNTFNKYHKKIDRVIIDKKFNDLDEYRLSILGE